MRVGMRGALAVVVVAVLALGADPVGAASDDERLAGRDLIPPGVRRPAVAGPEGSRPAPVRASGLGSEVGTWSPDGDRLGVTGAFGTTEFPAIVNRDGSCLQAVPVGYPPTGHGLFRFATAPVFAPDGRRVLVATGRAEPRMVPVFDLHVVDLPTGTDTTIVEFYGTDARWSPDGTTIAYGALDALRAVDPDGSDDRELVADGSSPAWSPDGSTIAFLRSERLPDGTPVSDLFVLDVASEIATRATNFASAGTVSSATFSADGESLYVSIRVGAPGTPFGLYEIPADLATARALARPSQFEPLDATDARPTAGGRHRFVTADAAIYDFGRNCPARGSGRRVPVLGRVVGAAEAGERDGTWLAASNGVIGAAGPVPVLGDLRTVRLARPVVGIEATPGLGYWLVASDGGVFSFGDARFFGSTGAMRLNRPIVGMAATPSGRGYWLVASDGGVFSFGDARFFGSTGGIRLNQPIVDMAATPSGRGYWLAASDGGVFTFGDAPFRGALPGNHSPAGPVVAFTPSG